MKAYLKFDLSNPDDAQEFKSCTKTSDMIFVICELKNYLRGQLKYAELTDEQYKTTEQIRDKLIELLSDVDLLNFIDNG